jgi:hypothetical protein
MKALLYCFAMFLFAFSTKAQWNSNTDINLDIAEMAVADLQTGHTSDGKTILNAAITGEETKISLGKKANAIYFLTIMADKKETYKIIKY